MIVLFCASGLGVVGSLTEGITGDFQLLFVKALMDFFHRADIFHLARYCAGGNCHSSIAYSNCIGFPAKLIMPYMDDIAFADFSACGGIIMIAVGLRIAQIKIFAVVNFLPALLFVVPISYLWRHFMT